MLGLVNLLIIKAPKTNEKVPKEIYKGVRQLSTQKFDKNKAPIKLEDRHKVERNSKENIFLLLR